MPGLKQITALIFASSLTLAGCAHAAEEAKEVEVVIKVDGQTLQAELAEALADIEEAADDMQEAHREMKLAELEFAQLEMDQDEQEAVRQEIEAARVELEQARTELERAKEEVHRSARELKESLAGEDGHIKIEIETEVEGEEVESHIKVGEPAQITPENAESND